MRFANCDSVKANLITYCRDGGVRAVRFSLPGSDEAGAQDESEKEEEALVWVAAEFSKKGFMDKSGNMVIEPQFGDAHNFSEGLAAVKVIKAGKWGFIDKSGKIIIKPRFKSVGSFQ